MISDADRAAIDAALQRLDVSRWAPLNDAERDLVSRAFTSGRVPEQHHPQGRAPRGDSTPGRAPGRRRNDSAA